MKKRNSCSAIAFANWFIRKNRQSTECLEDLDGKKMAKLLYFANAHFIGKYKVPLFYERVLYDASGPIIENLFDVFGEDTFLTNISGNIFPSKNFDEYLNDIFNVYGQFSFKKLSAFTCQKGEPWSMKHRELKKREKDILDILIYPIIETNLIAECFKDRV